MKTKLLSILILVFPFAVFCQENQKNKYLDDISDLVGTAGKGLQIQTGVSLSWSKDNKTKNSQYNLPAIIPRYAFNEHFGLQGQINLNINQIKKDQQTATKTGIDSFTLGAVYEFNPDYKFAIFNQFSINWDNTFALNDNETFYSELDLNFSTRLNERAELDYTLGYGFQESNPNMGIYSFELDYYITHNLLIEIANNGQWNWNNIASSFQHAVAIDLAFLTEQKRQFNLTFIKGINYNFNAIGFSYTQNF